MFTYIHIYIYIKLKDGSVTWFITSRLVSFYIFFKSATELMQASCFQSRTYLFPFIPSPKSSCKCSCAYSDFCLISQ